MAHHGMPDFSQIMKIAQQVASKIDPPAELKSGRVLSEDEMNKAISSLAKSVTQAVTPEMFESMNTGDRKKKGNASTPFKNSKESSKISFVDEPIVEETNENENENENKNENKTSETESKSTQLSTETSKNKKKKTRVVEIESDCSEDIDNTTMRTNDMSFTLTVKLEELYTGTRKKLAIRRQKIGSDRSYFEEKKKLAIKIEPGMMEDNVIRFNHLSDEKIGYETGDVVVTLDVEEHPYFMRDGNNLLIEKEISLSEAYNPVVYVEHLNGKTLKITGEALNVFSDEDTMLKKVPGCGMPILGEKNSFGDLFIRFKCVNKTKITPEIIDVLTKVFPPLLIIPNVKESDIIEKQLETVTESDLEFLESDSDSDEYSDEEYTDSDEESE
jgi:DnaJ-class molecular chaperone